MEITEKASVQVLKGNSAAARAVLLCKPDVVAAYPITPQSPVVEEMSKFKANGDLQAEFVEVEGEHSAMSVLIGASSAGGRVFSATSSNGLAFMFEAYFYASTLRLPIVMVQRLPRTGRSQYGLLFSAGHHDHERRRLDPDTRRILPGNSRYHYHGL